MRAEMIDQLGQSVPVVVAEPGVIGPADDAVEERLAAIEDTLDGLAERFEALARDSAMDAGERLGLLDDRIAALALSLQAERSAAAAQRELDGANMRISRLRWTTRPKMCAAAAGSRPGGHDKSRVAQRLGDRRTVSRG